MEFLNILSWGMLVLAALYVVWVLSCAFYSLFMKIRIYPQTDKNLRFAVISCARNEENVIANLIDSLKRQDYPRDCFDIFIVAHNCRDHTAMLAEKSGACVFIRNCPTETHKGDALHFGLEEIQKRGTSPYDAFVVFDADNIAGTDFLKAANAALQSGADVVQGFRASKNYDDNLLTRLFGCLWMAMIYAQNLPHTAMHLPATVSGTGFAARFSALAEEGWCTETLCEDIEFTVQQTLMGHQCIASAEAIFYDEQPNRLKPALQQRFRWAVGINQCFTHYIGRVLRVVPKYGTSALKMALDISMNPFLIVGILGIVLQGIVRIYNGVSPATVLMFTGLLAGGGWLAILPITLNLLFREKLPFFKNIGVIFFLPFFLFFSGILAVIAPFCRNAAWKPIPHNSTKTLGELERKE